MTLQTIAFEKREQLKQKPNSDQLGFGKYFTDHMFLMDYDEQKDWHNPRIVPYQSISVDPSAMIFHYGQTVFEGLKAYRTEDDQILLFRPENNMKRLNQSSKRMSIPEIDEEEVLHYLQQLIAIEQDWVPSAEGTSLYIRPVVIATDPNLSVEPSKTYTFMIILSPVGSYYPQGIKPVSIRVEQQYTRAVKGGTGTAKTAANYSGAYKAQEKATEQGLSQVLWLDGIEKKYIEEVGSMNVFFKIDGEVITPELNGSILEGITRKSTIELLNHWGIPVKEQKISMAELHAYYHNGKLEEAFGTGTAAVISPIGELIWENEKLVINEGQIGEVAKKLYDTITGIQTGKVKDRYGWTVEAASKTMNTSPSL
ncbi:branched-chain amino acid aminotransferase [Texcoconibacillus texcoconensis]|uniref:Branched-chain-amino-acid aminotransferase n=1 Tax=Texcoconibacillus texcoconensis TaxID=1095777 RepID=A0A840QQR8_9BACI|nr:branched-chain amino acid aminotransferase [Texcoconibacillus texcoconensis]MBB5173700.1 branched-chain amino acid aminotransferase [Texcoconibacillus texcoconensis]